ncbi:MAG: Hsp20/alpha crystallin family protein [Planctomycetes bacterium]|nr:Hsp20/alpha crystallin family protein [Planctomycetota bacterium]
MAIPIRNRAVRQGDPWSPFDEFDRAMNRVLGDLYPTRAEYPPVNIWTGKGDMVLTAELPGLESEDLDISVHENIVSLRCAPKAQPRQPQEGVTYHRRECAHAGFSRSWRLPFEVDPNKVEAKLENGVLKLTLPQSEASKPKKIEIKAT